MHLATPWPAMPAPVDVPGPPRARHGLGPPAWTASLPLPRVLGCAAPGHPAELTAAQAARASRQLAAALRHRLPAPWLACDHLLFDVTLWALVQRFAAATDAAFEVPGRTPRVVLDAWVGELVTWGRARRVWFGVAPDPPGDAVPPAPDLRPRTDPAARPPGPAAARA